MKYLFVPKMVTVFKNGYTLKQLRRDILAGITVGIVALPLALAFAIASGVTPEKGIYTAIIGGFIISLLGGSKVQIGGPTGAFIVIVAGIVGTYGVAGLTTATLMAGIMIILMGLARLGSVIKFIPYSLVVGFTSGIALIIFSTQIKDLLGLSMDAIPSEFFNKMNAYSYALHSFNYYAAGIGILTIGITLFTPRITSRIPGSLISIALFTVIARIFQLPVETIQTRFGNISGSFPHLAIPTLDFHTVRMLILPAFTIAMLGSIESLLSAVVSDGLVGGTIVPIWNWWPRVPEIFFQPFSVEYR